MSTPDFEFYPSSLKLIHRIDKSEFNKFGIVASSRIPITRPAMVIFGGDCTETRRIANNYASVMESILRNANINDVDIYSVYYSFGDRDSFLDRINIFRMAKHRITMRQAQEKTLAQIIQAEPTSPIVRRAYDMIFQPRFINSRGYPRDMDAIIKYMGRLFLWGHSHGAAMIRALGEYAHDRLQELGFNESQISKILGHVLVIQHAPITPLHHQRFNTLTFASASDYMMDLYNEFSDWMADHGDAIPPIYLGPKYGNIICAGKLASKPADEHDMCALRINTASYHNLSPNGRVVFDAEQIGRAHV